MISTKVRVANSERRVTLSLFRREDSVQHPTLWFLATSLSLLSIPEEDKRPTFVAQRRCLITLHYLAKILRDPSFLLLMLTAGIY